jgi:hypothetical protein
MIINPECLEVIRDTLEAAREYVEVEASRGFRPAQRLLERIDHAIALTLSRQEER